MLEYLENLELRTVSFRVKFAGAIAAAGMMWGTIGLLSVSAQPSQESYNFNAVANERRFTTLETQVGYLSGRLDEVATAVKEIREAQKGTSVEQYRDWFMMVLLSGVLGEGAFKRVRDRLAKDAPKIEKP